jgi:hypothetical protein
MEGKTGRVCSSISRLVSRWKRNFFKRVGVGGEIAPRGKKHLKNLRAGAKITKI